MIQFGGGMGSVSGPMRREGMRCDMERERVCPEVRTHGPPPGRSYEETARAVWTLSTYDAAATSVLTAV